MKEEKYRGANCGKTYEARDEKVTKANGLTEEKGMTRDEIKKKQIHKEVC